MQAREMLSPVSECFKAGKQAKAPTTAPGTSYPVSPFAFSQDRPRRRRSKAFGPGPGGQSCSPLVSAAALPEPARLVSARAQTARPQSFAGIVTTTDHLGMPPSAAAAMHHQTPQQRRNGSGLRSSSGVASPYAGVRSRARGGSRISVPLPPPLLRRELPAPPPPPAAGVVRSMGAASPFFPPLAASASLQRPARLSPLGQEGSVSTAAPTADYCSGMPAEDDSSSAAGSTIGGPPPAQDQQQSAPAGQAAQQRHLSYSLVVEQEQAAAAAAAQQQHYSAHFLRPAPLLPPHHAQPHQQQHQWLPPRRDPSPAESMFSSGTAGGNTSSAGGGPPRRGTFAATLYEELTPPVRAVAEDNKVLREEVRRYKARARDAEVAQQAAERALMAARDRVTDLSKVRPPIVPGRAFALCELPSAQSVLLLAPLFIPLLPSLPHALVAPLLAYTARTASTGPERGQSGVEAPPQWDSPRDARGGVQGRAHRPAPARGGRAPKSGGDRGAGGGGEGARPAAHALGVSTAAEGEERWAVADRERRRREREAAEKAEADQQRATAAEQLVRRRMAKSAAHNSGRNLDERARHTKGAGEENLTADVASSFMTRFYCAVRRRLHAWRRRRRRPTVIAAPATAAMAETTPRRLQATAQPCPHQ